MTEKNYHLCIWCVSSSDGLVPIMADDVYAAHGDKASAMIGIELA